MIPLAIYFPTLPVIEAYDGTEREVNSIGVYIPASGKLLRMHTAKGDLLKLSNQLQQQFRAHQHRPTDRTYRSLESGRQ